MNERLRRSAAHVFVDHLSSPSLTDDDAHHLLRVLRVRDSDEVSVSDGQGSWMIASLGADGELHQISDVVSDPEPAWRVGVGFVPIKGEKPELVAQKLTEVGVDDIVVVANSTRQVVRWVEDKRERNIERLGRVVREAAMQSRRSRLPSLRVVNSLGELSGVAVAEPGGEPLVASDRFLVVGPEGGFAQDEIAGFSRKVSLGEFVLRAETAAIVAGVLLTGLRERTR